MKFKTISLVLCGFLLISLSMGGSLLAQTETDVPLAERVGDWATLKASMSTLALEEPPYPIARPEEYFYRFNTCTLRVEPPAVPIITGCETGFSKDITEREPWPILYDQGEYPPVAAVALMGNGRIIVDGGGATLRSAPVDYYNYPLLAGGKLGPPMTRWLIEWDDPKGHKFLYYWVSGAFHTAWNMSGWLYTLENELGFEVGTQEGGTITPELLENYDVFHMMGVERQFSSSEIQALADWVESGGGLLLAEQSDYGGYSHVTYANEILEGLGVPIMFQDDELYDEVSWVIDGPWFPQVYLLDPREVNPEFDVWFPTYDLTISMRPTVQAGYGESVTFTLTVKNTGTEDTTYQIEVTETTTPTALGWSFTVEPETVTVAAGENTDVVITVTIPEAEEEYLRTNWLVTVTDQNQTFVTAKQEFGVMAVKPAEEEPSIPGQENVSLDLLLEFKSTGRCRIKADYSGPNPLYSYLTVAVPPEVSPPPHPPEETSFAANFSSLTNDLIYKNLSQIDENLDTTPPTITLAELSATTDKVSITVSGTVTKDAWEDYADITINVQIGLTRTTVPVLADGSWSLNVSLREGPNTITAWAIDSLDNPSDVKSASIERTVTPTSSILPTIPTQLVSGEINWEINIELTSPSEGMLTLTANGWVVLPFTEEQKQMISMGVAAYKLAPGMFNQQLLQYISSSLSYPQYDLEITNLSITELDWDGAASKLTFGATLTAESSMFGAELRRELPMSITTTGTGSIPTTITSIEDLEGLTFDALLRVVTKTVVAELQMNFTGVTSTIGLDFEFELRTDNVGVVTRTDNMIVVDFGGLRGYLPAPTPVSDEPEYENVTFTLRVPLGAEVENLPSGYTQTDTTYTWTGPSAISAILELVTGEAGTRISYWVGPATAAIENIQGSVGQTIEVENNYIESVEIESERAIVVKFEKDQPVRKLRVALATAIENLDVQAQRLSERPEGVAEPPAEKGLVCYYLEVRTTAPEQVESSTMEFRVSKLWISVNNIDQSTVRLLRYQDRGWVELETTKIGDDENNVYFEATTPGYSVFAITGEVEEEAPSPIPLILLVVIAASAGGAGAAAALWVRSRRRPPSLKRVKRVAKRRTKGKRRVT